MKQIQKEGFHHIGFITSEKKFKNLISRDYKKTILYSHPNAVDIGEMYTYLQVLHKELKVNILHYEYIGYGLAKSLDSPNELNTYECVEAAHKVNFTLSNRK